MSHRNRDISLAVMMVVTAMLVAIGSLLATPGSVVRAFGEWGWNHLLSADARARLVNDRLAAPDVPLLLAAGGVWPVAAPYMTERLRCESIAPVSFVVIGPDDSALTEPTIERLSDDTFTFRLAEAPLRIIVRVTEILPTSVRVSITAERAP